MATFTVTDPKTGRKATLTSQDNTPPTEQELEQIFASNNQQSQQQSGNALLSDTPIPEEKSAVSIPTRAWLSFHDKQDQEKILKKDFSIVQPQPDGNFLVGNDSRDLQPVTPDGLLNDLAGKLADHAADIPVIAGQLGALALVPEVAIPGRIAASAAGAGAGQAISSTIGEKKLNELATDVAISSAFGAAGEGLVQGAVTGSKVLAPKISNMLGKLNTNSAEKTGVAPEATPFAKTTTKLFKYLANVPEESTQTFFKYGMQEMNNPTWFKKETILPLVDDTVKALEQANLKLGKAVGQQTAQLKGLAKNESIPVDDLFNVLREDAKNLGILDETYAVNKLYPNSADIKPITNLLKEMGDVQGGRYMYSPGKKINVEKALQLSKSFGQKFENVSPEVQSSFYKVLNGEESLGLKGIRPRITDTAEKLGLSEYASVNKKYSDLLKLQDRLSSFDTANPGKIESFINRLETTGQIVKRDLAALDNMMGGGFTKKWSLFNAAQDFNKTDLNVLRFGAIASTLGGLSGGGFNPFESKPATLIGAGLLGTPAGLKTIIRLANKSGIAISKEKLKQLGMQTGARIDKRAASALLTQLIANKSKSFNNKNNSNNNDKEKRKF